MLDGGELRREEVRLIILHRPEENSQTLRFADIDHLLSRMLLTYSDSHTRRQ